MSDLAPGAVLDAPDVLPADAEGTGYDGAGISGSPDQGNLFVREAASEVAYVPRGIPTAASPLNLVRDVFGVAPCEQVVGIDARRVVAPVSNLHLWREFDAAGVLVDPAVSPYWPPPVMESPVAVSVSPPLPLPTVSGVAWRDVAGEACRGGGAQAPAGVPVPHQPSVVEAAVAAGLMRAGAVRDDAVGHRPSIRDVML